MKKHLLHCHAKLFPTLLEMERQGSGSAADTEELAEADVNDDPDAAAAAVTIIKRKQKPQKARQQVKVSFISTAGGANKNVDDNDDDGTMPTAAAAAAAAKKHGNSKGGKGGGGSSSSSAAGRPRFMVGMIGDIDITKCPEEYKDRATAPTSNKRSIWWNAYHEIKEEEEGRVCALCNLCSKILSMGT
jgi:hypothetical protein